jgi:hypothetical protein
MPKVTNEMSYGRVDSKSGPRSQMDDYDSSEDYYDSMTGGLPEIRDLKDRLERFTKYSSGVAAGH